MHSHAHFCTVDQILKGDALESQSVLDVLALIYLPSQVKFTGHEVTEQNQLPLGALKITCLNEGAEESLVQENNFQEIVEAQTILKKSPIVVTNTYLLIGIGFGRCSGLVLRESVLDSGVSGQDSSLGQGH